MTYEWDQAMHLIGGSLIQVGAVVVRDRGRRCVVCDCQIPAGAFAAPVGEEGEGLACTASCVAAIHGFGVSGGESMTVEQMRAYVAECEQEAWALEEQVRRLEDKARVWEKEADRLEAALKNLPTPLDWLRQRQRGGVPQLVAAPAEAGRPGEGGGRDG
jgi:hypothetical protein